jgi:hypothetical protein
MVQLLLSISLSLSLFDPKKIREFQGIFPAATFSSLKTGGEKEENFYLLAISTNQTKKILLF